MVLFLFCLGTLRYGTHFNETTFSVYGTQFWGPLHMSPVDRAGSLTGTNFILGSYEKFQPGFRDEKRPKTSCGAKFEKQNKHSETQNYNFHAYCSFGCTVSQRSWVRIPFKPEFFSGLIFAIA